MPSAARSTSTSTSPGRHGPERIVFPGETCGLRLSRPPACHVQYQRTTRNIPSPTVGQSVGVTRQSRRRSGATGSNIHFRSCPHRRKPRVCPPHARAAHVEHQFSLRHIARSSAPSCHPSVRGSALDEPLRGSCPSEPGGPSSASRPALRLGPPATVWCRFRRVRQRRPCLRHTRAQPPVRG